MTEPTERAPWVTPRLQWWMPKWLAFAIVIGSPLWLIAGAITGTNIIIPAILTGQIVWAIANEVRKARKG